MLNTPFAPWPSFTEEEAEAVATVIRSNRVNYWTGEEGRQFERDFADWVGTSHAIAVANGTVALDLALKGLRIGAGDDVVVSPRTFIASASCVVNAGARPIFADVDPNSGNVTAAAIEAVITDRTKAIIVVHLAGWPAEMDPIMSLANSRNLKVVEDCAQAHGACYRGRSVGAIGHVGAWSFCQDKIITTGGEGGMVTLNDKELWSAMWSYKDHGKSWDAIYNRSHPEGFRWLHESFGTNWRMTEVQAVLGRIQLQRMSEWTRARNANAKIINEGLRPLAGDDGPVRLTELTKNDDGRQSVHAYYRYYAYVRPTNLKPGWDRDRIIREIVAAGVPCFQGSCSEVYLEKAFEDAGLAPPQRLPVAWELGDTSLAFLVHPTLTEEQISKTQNVAVNVLSSASRRS